VESRSYFIIALVVVLGTGLGFSINVSGEEALIPSWIKNTAKFWANDQVTDTEFINALQFMIQNNIIQVSSPNETMEDNGDFYVTYSPNPNTIYDYSAREWIMDSQYFEVNADYLNETFVLPQDIEIQLMECGEANAFYDWESKKIIVCYEFVDSVYADFYQKYEIEMKDGSMIESDITTMTMNVIDFVFYHELGHALTDTYGLPITGLEENAADQFATLFMLLYEDTNEYEGIIGHDILYNVGTWFLIQTELYEQSYYWDVHNLDIQRFYNISCYAYGQNPEYNQDLITDGYLPVERSENCAYEYSLMENSWNAIISKYYKN
jgi:hypothetical protein